MRDANGLVLVVARVPDPMNAKTYVVVVVDITYDNNKKKFPGGRIKIGETPIEAGIRELREETRLDALHARKPPRLIGTTYAYGSMPGGRYPVYFIEIEFSSDYAGRTLSGGYCEGKLISYLMPVPVASSEDDSFLRQHKERLRSVSEQVYTDLFVPV